jgi:hypothetical protein
VDLSSSESYTPLIEPDEPFLEELNTTNYIEPPTQQEKKEIEKTFKENLKQKNKAGEDTRKSKFSI